MRSGAGLDGRRRSCGRALALVAAVALQLGEARAQECGPLDPIAPARIGQAGCHLDSLGLVPIPDFSCQTYLGYEGGLYPDRSNRMPTQHVRDGMAATRDVVPRGPDGRPSAAGRIGFASIGMSNAEMEFGWFETLARQTPGLDPAVVRVNGAQGTRIAEQWADPDHLVWDVLDQRLAAAGLTPGQLQVVWVKLADGVPSSFGAFPLHARFLQMHLQQTLRNAKARYPNLAIAYLSSRTRAYTTIVDDLNPEPYAYESGFAVKWLVEQQIAGSPALRHQGDDPPAPWIAWGPYLWADGINPRSDGFTWECADVSDDFVHPWFSGQEKVASLLLAFLQTEPTASRWFVAPKGGCGLLGVEILPVLAFASLARRRR